MKGNGSHKSKMNGEEVKRGSASEREFKKMNGRVEFEGVSERFGASVCLSSVCGGLGAVLIQVSTQKRTDMPNYDQTWKKRDCKLSTQQCRRSRFECFDRTTPHSFFVYSLVGFGTESSNKAYAGAAI